MSKLPGETTRAWDPLYEAIDGMYEYKKSGLLCLPCMKEELMDEMMNDFVFRQGDILIVSYPQSGFLWLQETLWHMFNMETLDTPVKEKDPLCIRLPFLEHEFIDVQPMNLLSEMPSPRLIKTHMAFEFLEKQFGDIKDQVKIILWVQDPKNMLKNYHKFWLVCGGHFGFPAISWEKFYELFLEKQLFEGDWFDTNRSWTNGFSSRDNFMVLHYEDAAKDLEGTSRRLAEFTGVPDWQDKLPELQKCAAMQPFDKDPDYKSCMSENQIEAINVMIKEKMAGTGLDVIKTE